MTLSRELAGALAGRLDGPHSDQDTAAVASLAAEAVRYLNYATGTHAATGLTWPATAYAVLGSLTALVSRLPQLLSQLSDWLDGELAAGQLGDDSGQDPVLVVERARRHLEAAAVAAGMVQRSLSAAYSDTSRLHARLPQGGEA
jgi:hypothetical protein